MPATHLPCFVPDVPPTRGWSSCTSRSPFAVASGAPTGGSFPTPLVSGSSGSPPSESFLDGASPWSSASSSPCASPRVRSVRMSALAYPNEATGSVPASGSDRSVVLMALASKSRASAVGLSLPLPPSRSVSDVSSEDVRGRAGGAPVSLVGPKPTLLVGAREKGALGAVTTGHAVMALKKRVIGRFFGKPPAKPRQKAGWEEDTLR